jgi:hypothetical protein
LKLRIDRLATVHRGLVRRQKHSVIGELAAYCSASEASSAAR